MPELPEVETIARTLRPALLGAEISEAEIRWARTIAHPSLGEFQERIRGQSIQEVDRRGKFLSVRLSDGYLFIHLRMSGDLVLQEASSPPGKHERLRWRLRRAQAGPAEGQALVFSDPRKFGRVWLTEDPAQVVGDLGPEPLSEAFTVAWLYEQLRRHRRLLKPLLLDQTFLAGLGNIYTDEALYLARLHPATPSHTVTREQAERLHAAIQTVLQEGIRSNGASIDWVYRGGEFQNHFRVYGRTGQPCPTCGALVVKLRLGQRGTHFCSTCQPLREYAD